MEIFLTYLKVFAVGGFVCMLGQVLINTTKMTSARILVTFLMLGVVLEVTGASKASCGGSSGGENRAVSAVSDTVDKSTFSSFFRVFSTGFSCFFTADFLRFSVFFSKSDNRLKQRNLSFPVVPKYKVLPFFAITQSMLSESERVPRFLSPFSALNDKILSPIRIIIVASRTSSTCKEVLKTVRPPSDTKRKIPLPTPVLTSDKIITFF